MKEKQIKYAQLLLKVCLKMEENQPLFISGNIERIDFIRILQQEAYKLGIKDIYIEINDPYLKHEALLHLNKEELKETSYFDKAIWNTYAKKGSAFLMLASETPGLMKDIDATLLSDMTMYSYETRKHFDELRDKKKIAWCIAAVPTKRWAEEIFPESEDAVTKLWEQIFTICGIEEKDCEQYIEDKINRLQKIASILNDYHFTTLKYENTLGTNFTIDLSKEHIWQSGYETLETGKKVLVNFPTEEIFTSPDCQSAEGIVYASKPLSYQNTLIKNFSITLKNGEVVKCHAEEGEETLKQMITSCKNANRLGEVALVPCNSPIAMSHLLFYETLFDENAACHLALGASFSECLENGTTMSKEELEEKHLNQCTNHVDFMIGTEDLKITGFTQEQKEVEIFKDGKFSIEIEEKLQM